MHCLDASKLNLTFETLKIMIFQSSLNQHQHRSQEAEFTPSRATASRGSLQSWWDGSGQAGGPSQGWARGRQARPSWQARVWGGQGSQAVAFMRRWSTPHRQLRPPGNARHSWLQPPFSREHALVPVINVVQDGETDNLEPSMSTAQSQEKINQCNTENKHFQCFRMGKIRLFDGEISGPPKQLLIRLPSVTRQLYV